VRTVVPALAMGMPAVTNFLLVFEVMVVDLALPAIGARAVAGVASVGGHRVHAAVRRAVAAAVPLRDFPSARRWPIDPSAVDFRGARQSRQLLKFRTTAYIVYAPSTQLGYHQCWRQLRSISVRKRWSIQARRASVRSSLRPLPKLR
jgi:hypothetical protein